MSKNVAIIGESGVGKSSLINMICHGANAPTSNDRTGCTKEGKEYPCNLGGQLSCQVHDTIGLEEGRWGFFPDKKSQKKLKTYLKDSRGPWHFVVYCIPGGRGHLKKSHGKNYEKVKSMMDSVPLVVVVTHLEDFKDPLDRWWSDNQTCT
ncbi:P-loop containing nucleoside triphosphate hydrolase protein [Suillus variegatus]|nr:P-loop containing nucleoside triphosphate hydrolase protein [Suillus variegatus]